MSLVRRLDPFCLNPFFLVCVFLDAGGRPPARERETEGHHYLEVPRHCRRDTPQLRLEGALGGSRLRRPGDGPAGPERVPPGQGAPIQPA